MGFTNIIAQNPSKSPSNVLIPAFPDVEVIKKFDEIQIGDSSLFKEIPNIGRSADNPLNNIPGANAINMIANKNDLNQPKDLSDSGHSLLNTHSLVVPEGWSGLSSFLTPDNTNIENLFLPYQNQLIILYNQQGVYNPAQQLNTLVNWDAQSGYIAKFNQETSIEFSGQPGQSKVLSLAAGWNLIPVLSECPADVATLFGNLDVVVVKEVAGWKLYWPEMGINSIDELLPGNAYYVLMNSPAEITFPNCGTAPWQCGDVLVDTRDGQLYSTVQIGDQCWMAENLAYLPAVSPSSQGNDTDPYYYVYGYQGTDVNAAKATDNYINYGALYNWPASLNACSEGWHLPTDTEWTILTTFLGGQSVAGGKMKEAGTSHWYSPNTGATNSSGFTALPGGYRDYNGSFYDLSGNGVWWSSTERSTSYAWRRYLNYNYANVFRYDSNKSLGFSVRCLKD